MRFMVFVGVLRVLKRGREMDDTIQAKLLELGLLQPAVSGAGWELTRRARDLLWAALSNSEETALTKDLLKLGMIEPSPLGSAIPWVFTPGGRRLLAYLLNNPVATEEPH
jgi:hypothetical protein